MSGRWKWKEENCKKSVNGSDYELVIQQSADLKLAPGQTKGKKRTF